MLLITVSMLHASYNHFNHFFFVLSHLMSYVLPAYSKKWITGIICNVPEGTITVRDSDLYLYDSNGAVIIIQTGSMSSTQTGP